MEYLSAQGGIDGHDIARDIIKGVLKDANVRWFILPHNLRNQLIDILESRDHDQKSARANIFSATAEQMPNAVARNCPEKLCSQEGTHNNSFPGEPDEIHQITRR